MSPAGSATATAARQEETPENLARIAGGLRRGGRW